MARDQFPIKKFDDVPETIHLRGVDFSSSVSLREVKRRSNPHIHRA